MQEGNASRADRVGERGKMKQEKEAALRYRLQTATITKAGGDEMEDEVGGRMVEKLRDIDAVYDGGGDDKR